MLLFILVMGNIVKRAAALWNILLGILEEARRRGADRGVCMAGRRSLQARRGKCAETGKGQVVGSMGQVYEVSRQVLLVKALQMKTSLRTKLLFEAPSVFVQGRVKMLASCLTAVMNYGPFVGAAKTAKDYEAVDSTIIVSLSAIQACPGQSRSTMRSSGPSAGERAHGKTDKCCHACCAVHPATTTVSIRIPEGNPASLLKVLQCADAVAQLLGYTVYALAAVRLARTDTTPG